ncbi:MAG: nucleotidyltransferase [Fimbriimonadaceae bacterium]|nr:nucleotidyltransferase [Fimbriimonadaceae bacterium]
MLNSHGVEYLIIGAHALARYGHPRLTGDIDFFVGISEANAERLYAVLREFGFGATIESAAALTAAPRVFMLGRLPYRIDILTAIDGTDFKDAWQRRVSGALDGVPVHFLSLEDFVANKRAAGRPKDLADLDALGES